MGFLPISGLSSKAGATYLNPREPDFRLDFLTTLHRGGEAPYEHPKLHVMLQPLKFMEFSLVDVQQAVLLVSLIFSSTPAITELAIVNSVEDIVGDNDVGPMGRL